MSVLSSISDIVPIQHNIDDLVNHEFISVSTNHLPDDVTELSNNKNGSTYIDDCHSTDFNNISNVEDIHKNHPILFKNDICDNNNNKNNNNNNNNDNNNNNNDLAIYNNIYPLDEEMIKIFDNKRIIEDAISKDFDKLDSLNDIDKCNPFHTAISNHFDTLDSLNDINKCNPFHTAIAMLDRSESSNIVKKVSDIIDYFIVKGCDVNKLDENKQSPLMLSLKLGCIDIFNKLIQTKADILTIDNTDDSLLHIACRKGFSNVIEDLIELNKEIMYKVNNFNQTILHYSVLKNHIDIVKLIIRKNQNNNKLFEIKDNNGFTALLSAAGHNLFSIFKYLVDLNVFNINDRDIHGNTILHIACAENTFETVQYIIKELNFDINSKNNNLHTALDLAINICGPNSKIVELFHSNNNIAVICNKRIKTTGNDNISLSHTSFIKDISNMKALLLNRNIVDAFLLSMTLTEKVIKYWKPYKFSLNGVIVDDKLSKYIKYGNNEYLTKLNNYENINHNGLWLYRISLFQLQYEFFHHLKLTQSQCHSTILQIEYQEDQYHRSVNCFNPIYKKTSTIEITLDQNCRELFYQFYEKDRYKQILRVFNIALDHIEKNPQELLPNEVNQYFQID